jgi:hypothetical protein
MDDIHSLSSNFHPNKMFKKCLKGFNFDGKDYPIFKNISIVFNVSILPTLDVMV